MATHRQPARRGALSVHDRLGRQAGRRSPASTRRRSRRRSATAPSATCSATTRGAGSTRARSATSAAIEPDEHVTVIARVVSAQQHPYADRRRGGIAYRLEVVVATEDDAADADLLRQAEADRRLAARSSARADRLFSGKVGTFRGKLQLTNPQTRCSAATGRGRCRRRVGEDPAADPIYPATRPCRAGSSSDAIELALDLVARGARGAARGRPTRARLRLRARRRWRASTGRTAGRRRGRPRSGCGSTRRS